MQPSAHTNIGNVASLRRGQKVIARSNVELGEVLGIITRDDASFMHILRYGPGMDEIFIPIIAVHQVVGDHVYLDLAAPDLLGKAWHTAPIGVTTQETEPN
jgi:hypothetical protein